jgi:hypothetical protein
MPTIESAQAVKIAYEYLLRVSPEPSRLSNFRVEELQQNENKDFLVTLSYDLMGDFAFDKKREFKDFLVSATDSTVTWMKIRKV